jgi:hypothetical protein
MVGATAGVGVGDAQATSVHVNRKIDPPIFANEFNILSLLSRIASLIPESVINRQGRHGDQDDFL